MIRKATIDITTLIALWLMISWPWSYFEFIELPIYDTLTYPKEPSGGELFIHPRFWQGRLRIRYCEVVPGAPIQSKYRGPFLGFYYQYVTDSRYKAGTFKEWNLYIPIWFFLLLSALYPTIIYIRYFRGPFIRNRRKMKGLCLRCGYNLTGNVSGVCPECGTKISPCRMS